MLLPFSCWLCGRQLSDLARHHVLAKGKARVVVCVRCVSTEHRLRPVATGTRNAVAQLLAETQPDPTKARTTPNRKGTTA